MYTHHWNTQRMNQVCIVLQCRHMFCSRLYLVLNEESLCELNCSAGSIASCMNYTNHFPESTCEGFFQCHELLSTCPACPRIPLAWWQRPSSFLSQTQMFSLRGTSHQDWWQWEPAKLIVYYNFISYAIMSILLEIFFAIALQSENINILSTMTIITCIACTDDTPCNLTT